MAYIGNPPIDARSFGSTKFEFTATAGQTAFTGTDDNNKTLSFTEGHIEVYVNGVLMDNSDFSTSGGNTVTLAAAAAVNDIISVIAIKVNVPRTDYVPKTGGTFTGAVTVEGNLTVEGTTTTIDSANAQTVDLGDNDKIQLGDSNDLQIYHDGSHSRIDEIGTGALLIQTNGTNIQLNKGTSENMLVATPDGSVDLYYDNSKKLATTSTGIDVTGTVTADGLTVDDGDIQLNSPSGTGGRKLTLDNTDTGGRPYSFISTNNSHGSLGGGKFAILDEDVSGNDAAKARIVINSDGNTGIGLTDPGSYYAKNLVVKATSEGGITIRSDQTTDSNYFMFADGTSGDAAYRGYIGYTHNSPENMQIVSRGYLRIYTGDPTVQNVTIDTDGNTGIGTNNPAYTLSVEKDVDNWVSRIYNTGSDADASGLLVRSDATAAHDALVFGVYSDSLYRMAVKSDGKTGIGTTTPNSRLHIFENSNISMSAASDGQLAIQGNGYTGAIAMDATAMYIYHNSSARNLSFGVNESEKLRITNAGYNIAVDSGFVASTGATTSFYSSGNGIGLYNQDAYSSCGTHLEIGTDATKGWASQYINRAWSSGEDERMIAFYVNGSDRGTITSNTSGTTYNTTSDRRLKTDIQPIADGTEKLMAMNPVTHKWKADPHTGETVHGFIAQEMQEIAPEAVHGDPDGEAMMSMDYGRITPILVAALQDAHKKIKALEERLAIMETE